MMPSGPVLYMDLDQVITGDITAIVKECLKHSFSCYSDHIEWQGVKLGTAMMTFWPEQWHHIFDDFWENRDAIMQEYESGGDQVYLGSIIDESKIFFLNERYPDAIKSYKYDLRDKGKWPDNHTRLINFHGNPKPHQVDDAWVIQNWR